MSEQPTALWLADWLDVRAQRVNWNAKMNAAAAELRRLHARNGELLEALNKLEYSSDGYIKRYPEESEVNAAIARAEGKV
jgi:hypothetical protein